ncbi:hypothetical protein [Nocardia sp. NPDC051463]|uniref:hypothetical protein n=1 Tax=Nocardia sp. NPDC051463 TaxID=3154845 RepID=UPI00344E52E7
MSNHHCAVVGGPSRIADLAWAVTAIESLYGRALLRTHCPLRPADTLLIGEFLDRVTPRSVGAGVAVGSG